MRVTSTAVWGRSYSQLMSCICQSAKLGPNRHVSRSRNFTVCLTPCCSRWVQGQVQGLQEIPARVRRGLGATRTSFLQDNPSLNHRPFLKHSIAGVGGSVCWCWFCPTSLVLDPLSWAASPMDHWFSVCWSKPLREPGVGRNSLRDRINYAVFIQPIKSS